MEALSRGAQHVDFVEVSAKTVGTIRANLETLGVKQRAQVYRGDAIRFAERLTERSYDIVVADPPYPTNQALQLLEIFRQCTFARVLSVEHRASLDCPGDETRRYGDVALTFCYGSWHE